MTVEDINSSRELFQSKRDTSNQEEIQNRLDGLIRHTKRLHHLVDDFTTEGQTLSHTFTFCKTYVSDLAQLLLDYIAVKRDVYQRHMSLGV